MSLRFRDVLFVLGLCAGCTAPRSGVTPYRLAGCAKAGCPSGSYCAAETGYCATKSCRDGCPSGSDCNEGLDRCEGPSLRYLDLHTPAHPTDPENSSSDGLWEPPP